MQKTNYFSNGARAIELSDKIKEGLKNTNCILRIRKVRTLSFDEITIDPFNYALVLIHCRNINLKKPYKFLWNQFRTLKLYQKNLHFENINLIIIITNFKISRNSSKRTPIFCLYYNIVKRYASETLVDYNNWSSYITIR